MATLYLHIGTPKSGSSAIQGFLAKNRKLLNTKGYAYPNFGVVFEGIGDQRNAHFLIEDAYSKIHKKTAGKNR